MYRKLCFERNVIITRHQASQICGDEAALNRLFLHTQENGGGEMALLKTGAKLSTFYGDKSKKRPKLFQVCGYSSDGKDVFSILLDISRGQTYLLAS